ncbi:MAG TPA: hypothetical protein PLI23_05915 [Thermoclostridium caenicola]|uniref:hypothetical protein n=1 Tax=Thermoclostridium caenicola TaxID=659425 RepID=UPI002C5E9088|nr:hypothetical protein [Thermoclostridium caenicola]HPO76694.1 hypothetical protein [Thermoclostridium caenicola]
MRKLIALCLLVAFTFVSGCSTKQPTGIDSPLVSPEVTPAETPAEADTGSETLLSSPSIKEDPYKIEIKINDLIRTNVADVHHFYDMYLKDGTDSVPYTKIKGFPDKEAADVYMRNYYFVEVGLLYPDDNETVAWNTYLVNEDFTQVLAWDAYGELIEAWRAHDIILSFGNYYIAKSNLNGEETQGLYRNGINIESEIYEYIETDNKLYVYGFTGYTIVDLNKDTVKQLVLWIQAPVIMYSRYIPSYAKIDRFEYFSDEEYKILAGFKTHSDSHKPTQTFGYVSTYGPLPTAQNCSQHPVRIVQAIAGANHSAVFMGEGSVIGRGEVIPTTTNTLEKAAIVNNYSSSSSSTMEEEEISTESFIYGLLHMNCTGVYSFVDRYWISDADYIPDLRIKRFPDKNAADVYLRDYYLVELGLRYPDDNDFIVWNTYLVKDDFTQVLIWNDNGQFTEAWRQNETINTFEHYNIAKSTLEGKETLGLNRSLLDIESDIYSYLEKDSKLYVYGRSGYTIVDINKDTIKQLVLWDNAPVLMYIGYFPNYTRVAKFEDFTDEEQRILNHLKNQ